MPVRNRNAGFTLLELMTIVAIVAILAAIALPNFQITIRSNRVASSTNELIAALSLARSEAVRSARGGAVCASTAGTACDGTWSDGWMVWADADGDGVYDAGETVLRYSRGNPKLSVIGPAGAAIAFDARGRRRAAADQAVVLRPTDYDGVMNRVLTVGMSGHVSTAYDQTLPSGDDSAPVEEGGN